ncbi:MAG: MliC family protein [Patescibacteria group bacterium]|nr:MliC family protein [Patescibacteria group bacterium]
MNTNDKRFWTVVVVFIVLGAIFFWQNNRANAPQRSSETDMATTTDLTVSVASTTDTNSAMASTPVYTYACNDDKSATATFHLPKDDFINLHLSDGRAFILSHTISADGARYANANESMIFWTKGVGAFVMENGTTTYAGCVATRFP